MSAQPLDEIKDPIVSSVISLRTDDFDEVGLLELLLLLASNKRFIAKCMAVSGTAAVLLSFLLPTYYKAETRILPPQQSQSSAAAMLGQIGALANFAGKDLPLKNPADLYVAILKSRTVADALIKKFDLQSEYREKYLKGTREDLDDATTIISGKDGVISITVEDKNPARAADLANAYVDEVYKSNQRLAITEAAQRRRFYETELKSAKENLSAAELELKKTQETTGLIQLDGQSKVIIESVARARAEIAAKEVQIRSMQSFATDQNPDVFRLKNELTALKGQLAKLETGQSSTQIGTEKVPAAGLEYVRKLREVKYYETIFEVMAKQFEIAKIDEGKSAAVIEVLDPAIVPETKSRPKRVPIILAGFFLGGLLAVVWLFIQQSYCRSKNDPVLEAKLRLLQERFTS